MTKYALLFLLVTAGFAVLVAMLKSGKFLRVLIVNAACGIAALLAVYFIGGITGNALPLNGFTCAVSAAGGAPGVIYLLLMDVMTAL